MAKFCHKCGTQLSDNSMFCIACGAAVPGAVPSQPAAAAAPSQPVQPAPPSSPPPYQPTPPPAYQPVQPQAPYPAQGYAQPGYPPPPAGYPPPAAAYPPPPNPPPGYYPPAAFSPAPPAKSGSGLKILFIVLGVLFVGGLAVVGAMFYIGHKVVGKIEDNAAAAGIASADLGTQGHAFHGDACRFLSKADVSQAIGVTIVETKSGDNSCDYLAQGTASDMTAKHLSAMAGQRGVPSEQKDMIEKMAGGLFKAQQEQGHEADSTPEGTTMVLNVSIDENSARTQMQVDSKVLGSLGGGAGSGPVAGIGDEAFVTADGMMQVRKGDTLIRMMYVSCPCSTDQIKPLAKKVADSL